MSSEFQDIKIVSFDEKATFSDPNSMLHHAVLNLSASAPHDWSERFSYLWARHFYMLKSNASVSGSRLTIHCLLDQLQNAHIPELKKIISECNQYYREHLAEKKRAEAERITRELADKAKLAELKNTLKFD